jgi:nicotinamidase/pyrazinamidase
MQKTCVIAIDIQNDFMDIPDAPLKVEGAVRDAQIFSNWIAKYNPTSIISSLDSHYALDISHPLWWRDGKGNPIKPFIPITYDDIESGKYVARIDPKRSAQYVKDLEDNGEFGHFIWAEHCLIGTKGHALLPVYFDALKEWSNKNLRWVNFINKGINPATEHFGIFRANVPIAQDPNTQVNQSLFQTLNTYDQIFIAGQARNFCVINSLKQLLEIAPNLAPKLVILEDCTSDVVGMPDDFCAKVDGLYANAKSLGVNFQKSTDF